MRVFGIDFTSNPSARTSKAKAVKWMTLASCTLVENRLVVDEFELLNGETSGDFSPLEKALSSEGKWIAGIDVPLGLPIQCIEYFGLLKSNDELQSWEAYIRRCNEIENRKSFKEMIESWRHPIKQNKRDEFERVRKYRLVDKLAAAQSPMNCIRPPVGQMFYEATKRLISSPAKIAPVRLNNDERVIVEAYPRLVADRFIGSGNYKEADGLDHIRQLIIDQIRSNEPDSIMMQWYGISVQVSDEIANACVEDRDGDKLDSILCAVQAAWASRQMNCGIPTFNSTVMRNIISLEGWIADPFLGKWSSPTEIDSEVSSMSVQFGNPNPTTELSDAIPLYGRKEFASPTRSTIPMLSLLQRPSEVFDDIVKQLGISSSYDLYLEYKVRPPKGRGTASHTDVMLKSGSNALAIEAKWTEPMYETAGKWLNGGKDKANREDVLDGWLSLLERPARKSLARDDFNDSIYQMIHRAASAAASGNSPHLTYFLFKPSPDRQTASEADVRRELERLWALLGNPNGFPFSIVEINAEPTEAHRSIANLPKNEQTTSDAVVAALLNDAPLFHFTEFKITHVGGNS